MLADSDSNPEDRNEIHRWFAIKLIGEQIPELDIQQVKEMLGKLINDVTAIVKSQFFESKLHSWQRDPCCSFFKLFDLSNFRSGFVRWFERCSETGIVEVTHPSLQGQGQV